MLTLSTKKKVCLQRPHLLCPPPTGRGRFGAFRVQEIATSHRASSHHEIFCRLTLQCHPQEIKAWFFEGSCDLISSRVQKVPLKKRWAVFSSLTIFDHCAPFVQHRYPQGVASLDDHVDSSTVASKYLGEIRRIRRRHPPGDVPIPWVFWEKTVIGFGWTKSTEEFMKHLNLNEVASFSKLMVDLNQAI